MIRYAWITSRRELLWFPAALAGLSVAGPMVAMILVYL